MHVRKEWKLSEIYSLVIVMCQCQFPGLDIVVILDVTIGGHSGKDTEDILYDSL